MAKEEILITLEFETDEFNKQAVESRKEIKRLTEEQKLLRKAGREGSVQFQENATALRENKKELSATNKTIDNLTKANKANAGSNDQLKAQLSLQTAEYNKLSKSQRENSERGKELNTQINKTTSDLKNNEEAVGNNRRSVGDYGKALSATPFGSFVGGIKSMGAAFLVNPIGITILAIVGAFKLLQEAFTSTEKGQDKLSKVTNVFGTIIGKLFDVLEPLANFIFDVVIEAFEKMGEAAEVAAGLVSDALEFFGFEEAANRLDNFVDSTDKAAKAAGLVSDARAKSDKLERELTVEQAKAQALVAEARRKSNDVDNVSAADRKKALQEAADLTDALAAKQEEAASLRFKALQLENSLTNSNKDALEAEANAEAELISIQTQRANIQKGLLTDQKRVNNEIKKDNEARIKSANAAEAANIKAAEEATKKAIDQQKAELDLFIAQQGNRARTLEEELLLAEQVSAKQLAILEETRTAKLISETEYQTQKLEIEATSLQAQTELAIDNASRELEIQLEANQSRLDDNQFLSDELFIQEQESLEAQAEARREFERVRLEEGVITEQEFNDAIKLINEENELSLKELDVKKREADEEQRLVDLELKREIAILNGEEDFEFQRQQLEAQKNQEIDSAQQTGASIDLINKKFAALDKKIDQAKFNSKLDIASQTFGNLAAIAGKESAAGKALGVAQTTIDTYKGATAAYASLAGTGPAGPVLGGIAAAAAIAAGLANVKQIVATKTPTVKASRGVTMGIFGGKPHSQGGTKGSFDDGTNIEVEKGELFAVVNKKNTGLLSNLDALNTFGGNGDSFFERGGTRTFLQDGGIALDNTTGGVDTENQATDNIISAVENLPTPVVVVQDINDVQSDTAQVAVRAQL